MSDTYDLFQQGRAHMKSGRNAQATVALEKAKRREPQSRSIREALAIAYFRLGRWEEAEAEFRALVELSPADEYAHYGLGRALRNQGKREEATPHFKLARSLRPRPDLEEERTAQLVRAVVQRVREASVVVDGEVVAECGAGLVILLGVAGTDTVTEAVRLAAKVVRLRIFENDEGRFDLSLLDVAGEALVVSQFTLIADTRKGSRPSFGEAAQPDLAEPLYERFCRALTEEGVAVARGRFGARMEVSLVNQGPVTIVLDTQGRATVGSRGVARALAIAATIAGHTLVDNEGVDHTGRAAGAALVVVGVILVATT